jgi:hypothetical protein
MVVWNRQQETEFDINLKVTQNTKMARPTFTSIIQARRWINAPLASIIVDKVTPLFIRYVSFPVWWQGVLSI